MGEVLELKRPTKLYTVTCWDDEDREHVWQDLQDEQAHYLFSMFAAQGLTVIKEEQGNGHKH